MASPKAKKKFFYGWLLLAITMALSFLVYGSRYSLSIVYPVILDEFGWSRANTAIIFSINMLFYGFTAMVAGLMIDKFGPKKVILVGLPILGVALALASRASQLWHLYLSLGAMAAIGTNAAGFLPSSVMLSRWFVRWRGAAMGFLAAGGSLAFLIGIPFQYFMSLSGWRGAYLILAGLVVGLGLPLVLFFFRSRPQEMGLQPDGASLANKAEPPEEPVPATLKEGRQAVAKVMKTSRFWMVYASYFFIWGVAWYLLVAHVVAFLQDVGYSRLFAASVFGLYGVIYAGGTIFGFLSDIIGREKAFTLGCALAVLGVILLLLIGDASTPWLPYSFILSFALGMGIAGPASVASIADIYKDNFGAIYGFILAGFAFGAAISSWLAGFIFDVTGSYDLAFWLVLVSIVLAVVLLWLAAPRREGLPRKNKIS